MSVPGGSKKVLNIQCSVNVNILVVGSEYGAAMHVCMNISKAELERLEYELVRKSHLNVVATVISAYPMPGATVLQ